MDKEKMQEMFETVTYGKDVSWEDAPIDDPDEEDNEPRKNQELYNFAQNDKSLLEEVEKYNKGKPKDEQITLVDANPDYDPENAFWMNPKSKEQ